MITIKLKEAMEMYYRRTGERMTYKKLSEMTGISESSLRKTGSILSYHPTWDNVEILCRTLEVPLHDFLELIENPPKPKRRAKKKRPGGTVKR